MPHITPGSIELDQEQSALLGFPLYSAEITYPASDVLGKGGPRQMHSRSPLAAGLMIESLLARIAELEAA